MNPSDVFRSHKGVHVKLSKDVHAAFRQRLFSKGISMQRVFNEFARLVACDDTKATKIVNDIVQRDAKEAIARAEAGLNRRPDIPIDELDQEALYDLINEGDNDEEKRQ